MTVEETTEVMELSELHSCFPVFTVEFLQELRERPIVPMEDSHDLWFNDKGDPIVYCPDIKEHGTGEYTEKGIRCTHCNKHV